MTQMKNTQKCKKTKKNEKITKTMQGFGLFTKRTVFVKHIMYVYGKKMARNGCKMVICQSTPGPHIMRFLGLGKIRIK